MKKNKIIFILLLLLNLSCNSQVGFKLKTIEAKLIDYGKISPKNDLKSLSKITGIKSKFFTSSIYVDIENKRTEIPINDQVFNHDFFNKYNYTNQKIIKIHVQSYDTKNGEILIATKIE